MSPSERLKELSKYKGETWYKQVVEREDNQDLYDVLCSLDPTIHHRIGVDDVRIEYVTDDVVYISRQFIG